MKLNPCVSQRISKWLLGFLLAGAGFGLLIIGVSLFPVIGVSLAIPVFGMAIFIFSRDLNDQCEIVFED